MNEIIMIPVEQLHHHPENPRLELGDLTELAESIRQRGVMQNLTVIRGHKPSLEEWQEIAAAEGIGKDAAKGTYDAGNAWSGDGYTVVIGNRRMEASRMAGLAEVPCVISDMDHKEQIATMLMENMQRADLTVYEQAQGFQMMMDLGFSAKEIGEKTGFGETTVRRRLKMAELDKNTLKNVLKGKYNNVAQIRMGDFDLLAQVDSVKERNELLKEIGGGNFGWHITKTLNRQKAQKVKGDAQKALTEAKLKKLPKGKEYSGEYTRLWNNTVKLYEWEPGEPIAPETDKELFYTIGEDEVYFFTKAEKAKKAEPVKKTEEEKEEDRKRDLAWKTVDRCAETAAELRKKYVEGLTVSPKNAMQMMQHALAAAFGCMINYTTPTMAIKERMGVTSHVIPEIIAEVTNRLMDMPQSKWPGLILMMFESDWRERKAKPPMFAEGSRGYEFPKFKRNVMMELCYTWLTEFGYQMSTEEIDMMAGTHAVFQEAMA